MIAHACIIHEERLIVKNAQVSQSRSRPSTRNRDLPVGRPRLQL